MANSSIRRAVLLAAGRGTRMGSITEQLPKPMLPVQGRPMLDHILERMSKAGITEFCVVVGYRHAEIESHFKHSPHKIDFLLQDPVNGTGSAALLARSFTDDDPFLLSYGDILCDPSDYTRCMATLEAHAAASAVIAVREVDDPWQGAAVYELAGRVKRIVEKPPKGTSVTRWNSAGFYLFQPAVYRYLERIAPSPRGELELTSALEAMLEDRLDLRISPVTGQWRDVGRPEDLAAVNAAS
jgi:dTDP-glucose pyrophosphorylase